MLPAVAVAERLPPTLEVVKLIPVALVIAASLPAPFVDKAMVPVHGQAVQRDRLRRSAGAEAGGPTNCHSCRLTERASRRDNKVTRHVDGREGERSPGSQSKVFQRKDCRSHGSIENDRPRWRWRSIQATEWTAVVPFTTAIVMVPPLLLIVVSPARVVVAAPKFMTLLAVFWIVPERLSSTVLSPSRRC